MRSWLVVGEISPGPHVSLGLTADRACGTSYVRAACWHVKPTSSWGASRQRWCRVANAPRSSRWRLVLDRPLICRTDRTFRGDRWCRHRL